MKKLLLFSVLMMVLSSSCSSTKISTEEKEIIKNHWIHSHEEDQNEIRTYHSSDFNFPPSRGREKFSLKPNGELEYTPLSPNDEPIMYNGSWEIHGTTLKFEYNQKTVEYRISEISNKTLKLKLK